MQARLGRLGSQTQVQRGEPTSEATFLLETFANSLQRPRGQKVKQTQVVLNPSRLAEPPAVFRDWGKLVGYQIEGA